MIKFDHVLTDLNSCSIGLIWRNITRENRRMEKLKSSLVYLYYLQICMRMNFGSAHGRCYSCSHLEQFIHVDHTYYVGMG